MEFYCKASVSTVAHDTTSYGWYILKQARNLAFGALGTDYQ